LKGFFQLWLNYFSETLDWLSDCIYDFYEWFLELVTDIWRLVSDTVTELSEWFLDWIWFIGEWLWEFVLSCGDGLIGLCIDMLFWLFDTLLPNIQMPQGFETGLTYFIQFGMLLNEILPIREALSLFALYVTIRVSVGIYYYVKTMPFRFIIGG
jgi:hypothetical protein